MQTLCGFGIVASPEAASAALEELGSAIERISPVRIEGRYYETYDPLNGALTSGTCAFAWMPPFVAHQMMRAGIVSPVAALGRRGGTSYHTAFLVPESSPIRTPEDFAGKRVAWVSRISAAGYVFPRLHLRSLGLEAKTLFASETFSGGHLASIELLGRGEVDVIATYANPDPASRALKLQTGGVPTRVVTSAGPIPSDVIVASAAAPFETRRSFARALLALHVEPEGAIARLMNVTRFEPVPHQHFGLLDQWLPPPKSR